MFYRQKISLTNKDVDHFYHLEVTHNKTTNEDYNKSVEGTEKKRLINTTGADEQAPWSNAFNFKKAWGTTVDPRTGILSAYVKT
ncbi:MAG: hypothetical protein OXC48_03860, partial [Endozoicomonadaceae bacterium]|nr:hypothetical protein [Endozoicomonadaceae bacterium]